MPTTDHDHHLLDLDIPIFRPIDGIFSERQLSEILYSLEGQNMIPTKYIYLGDKGVEHWITRSFNSKEEFMIFTQQNMDNTGDQYQMMNNNLDLVLGALKDKDTINLIDVGCGTGFPVYPILSYLKDKKQFNKYIPIDICEKMCDLAINNLKSMDVLNKNNYAKLVHDFEDGHFADFMVDYRKDKTTNLFTFIGSTLGNMMDRHRALANIRDSMTEGDLLWIGTVLYNCGKELVDFYSKLEINSEEYFRRHRHHAAFLESFGMKNWSEFGHIVVEEVDKIGLLRYSFVIEKPFALEFKIKKNKKPILLNFSTGEKVAIFQLKNYHENDLISELRECGFEVNMLNIDKKYTTALALVSV
jgi:uncharacterized SAM-dependent methyltransferase